MEREFREGESASERKTVREAGESPPLRAACADVWCVCECVSANKGERVIVMERAREIARDRDRGRIRAAL